jgi:hypothetical protein
LLPTSYAYLITLSACAAAYYLSQGERNLGVLNPKIQIANLKMVSTHRLSAAVWANDLRIKIPDFRFISPFPVGGKSVENEWHWVPSFDPLGVPLVL